MLWQGRSIRQSTGGRYRPSQGKRRTEIGSAPADTHIGDVRCRIVRVYGGNHKVRAMRMNFANVANRANGEIKKVKLRQWNKMVQTRTS